MIESCGVSPALADVSPAPGAGSPAPADVDGARVAAEQAASTYALLTGRDDVVDYLVATGLLPRLAPRADDVEVAEVTAGNMNRVFIARGPSGSVAVKQAPPWVQVAGPEWPVDPGRIASEARAYELLAGLVPASVPTIDHVDLDRYVMVMEDLSDLTVLRDRLVGQVQNGAAASDPIDFVDLGTVVGRFCAELTFATSAAGMPDVERRALIDDAANPELCAMTDAVVLDEPFREHEHNSWHPVLESRVRAMYADAEVRGAAADIRAVFASRVDALIHGDLHTGSVMIGTRDGVQAVKVFDPEFAFVGPAGMDIGLFWANVSIASVAARHAGLEELAAARLEAIPASWAEFVRVVADRWPDRVIAPEGLDLDGWLDRIRTDAWGFAGVEAIRRVAGYAAAADLSSLPTDVAGAAHIDVFDRALRWILERSDESVASVR